MLSDGNEYLWGLGLIGQVTASGTATYAQSDGLGSIRLLTDSSGNVVGTQQYDAFGASRAPSGVQLPFGFTGEHVDPESGLVYLQAHSYGSMRDPCQSPPGRARSIPRMPPWEFFAGL